MASEYNLALKATLDTSQVQQELQRLKQSYKVGSEDGNSFSKGVQGAAHMQKLEVQLTRLGQSITGLQRAIEQLARSYNRTTTPVNSNKETNNQNTLPIAPPKSSNGKANLEEWLDSKEYKKINNKVANGVKKFSAKDQQVVLSNSGASSLDDPLLAHKILSSPYGKRVYGNDYDYNKMVAKIQEKQQKILNIQRAAINQNRQIASIIGGQLFGGAGELATGFGYNTTGAVLGGIGQGVTAGGSAAFGATLMGIGSAAGPIGIIVGLGSAALAVTKSLYQMNEAAKQAADNQLKVADALRQTSISQSMDRYLTWQGIRSQQVLKENNLPVAKDRAAYFKKELNKAQGIFFSIQDPKAYEEKIRKDAELKKNLTVTKRSVVSGGGTATGNYSTYIQEYKRQLTDEEKAAIDKAANEAILAHQKKFDAAKKEYQAAIQNANTWEQVADALQKQKDAADKMSRETRNQEFLKRRQLREGALFASEAYIQSDRIRSTQIMAMDIMNNKQSGPLEKFNKIAEELDRLRSDRKSLVEKAYGINKDIANGERDSNELADMIKRRDALLKDASFIAERAGILENALGSISTGTIAPDLSHVTSLAQYGFNMGEKDNSVERMEKYYNKSLNLQQQIKDKLQEGVKTEAVYN